MLSAEDDASLLASYWGKADPAVATPGRSHHTVLGHCLDVAACAFVLLDHHPALRRQLLGHTGAAGQSDALAVAFACSLHDIGKIDTRFQRKAPSIASALRPHTSTVDTVRYDHGTEGFRQVEDDPAASELIQASLGDCGLPLLRAVCGHHGSLPTRDEPDPSRSRLGGSIRREDARARATFLKQLTAFFKSLGANLPVECQADGALVQRVAGLCAVSDWLGSNVEFFPYEPGPIVDLASYWERSRERARSACRDAGLLRAEPRTLGFTTLFPGYLPRDVQTLTEQVDASVPGLVIVEAEMGKGKTEAALSLAAKYLGGGLSDGLTVALPTMATSNAMFARVEALTPRLFPADDVQLALAHGRASRQPKFQALVQRGLRARDDDATEASVACARWLVNRKRILLAQVGVGTVDQALQAALQVRHQFVRMFGLSRNVVIIDEVHAYDAYMEVLLEHLLSWLGALQVPVILLSATLPSARRAALASAWRGDGGGDQSSDEPEQLGPDTYEQACERPYPLVSVTTRAGNAMHSGVEATSTRTLLLERVERAHDDEPSELEAVASRLVDAAQRGARVVWIRNTVREAQRAFRAVSSIAGGIEHLLFHARFRGCDRSRVETLVLERFGKQAPIGGRVLIATQVVEQSLDLDFDELHTDLAPIDLLFQRAGRLHRHDRERPAGFERPRLVVHLPSTPDADAMRFGPSRYVYDAGTLWIAQRTVCARESLQLPDDIRPLVEQSYHPASRAALLAESSEGLRAAESALESELEARRTKARQCCIEPTSADPDGGATMDDDDDAVQAFTRDGQSVTLLPFDWDGRSARALDAEPSSEPWALDAARADAWRLAGELVDQTLSVPARGSADTSAPGDDAAAWATWRSQFERFGRESGLGHRVVPLPMSRHAGGHKGWLTMGGRRRRVLYTRSLGLVMVSEKDEEEAR